MLETNLLILTSLLGILSTLTTSYLITLKEYLTLTITNQNKTSKSITNTFINTGILLSNIFITGILIFFDTHLTQTPKNFFIITFFFLTFLFSILQIVNINFIDFYPYFNIKHKKNSILSIIKVGFSLNLLFILSNPIFFILLQLLYFSNTYVQNTPHQTFFYLIFTYSISMIAILQIFSKLPKKLFKKILLHLITKQKTLNLLTGLILITTSLIQIFTLSK